MPQLLDLPPQELAPNPKNPRQLPLRVEDFTPEQREGLVQLGKSMRVKQLQPVLAHPTKPKPTVLVGGRRLWAAILEKLPTIQVLMADKELSEPEQRGWAITENIHREDMTGWELFTSFSDLMCINPAWQMKDLSDYLKVSPSSTTRNLSPSKLSQEWQDALRDGKVTLSACYHASKADKSKHAGLLALALRGVSCQELDKAAKPGRRKGKAARLAKLQLALPDGVSLTVAAKSLTLDDLIGVFASVHREAEAAKSQKLDASAFQAVLKSKAKG